MSWILATLIAAAAQTARNAMQRTLTGALGTLGATQVRFVFGLPFALLFLLAIALVTNADVPHPTPAFLGLTAVGAIAQIFGTAALLASMHTRSFSVATAFSKTEPVQAGLFGLILLGERLPAFSVIGIVVATLGVILLAIKPGESRDARSLRPALMGIASGAFFAISAVGFRGGVLALGDGPFFVRAATMLVWSLGFQSLLLVAWMSMFARPALARSLGMWRQSLFAGFMGAFASQFWFIAISLTPAANVRTLALIEVLFAQAVSRRLFAERHSLREVVGMVTMLIGVALLVVSAARP